MHFKLTRDYKRPDPNNSVDDLKNELYYLLSNLNNEKIKEFYNKNKHGINRIPLYYESFDRMIKAADDEFKGSFAQMAIVNDLMLMLKHDNIISTSSEIWSKYMGDNEFDKELIKYCVKAIKEIYNK